MTAEGYTGGNVSISDVNGLQAVLDALQPNERILTSGESVLRRGDISASFPLESGTMFVTHFRAAKTEAITKLRTGTGDGTTVGVSATHAWIGVLRWDGTNYIPVTESVDDPTRWTTQFATYDTPLQATFNKTKGVDYALYILWIGSGQVPALPGAGGWYQDSLTAPRTNGLIFSQTQPPAAPLSGAFFGSDNRRFQAVMLP
jgi:hypothetical protein